MADTPAKPKLLDLAASRFGDISPAEQKLLEAAADGKDADCTSLSEKDRVIQAERLLWLCTKPDASAQVTYRGISIVGAQIEGELNLECAKISFPLRTRQCVFKEAIVLRNSHLVSLNLATSSIRNLRAENLVTERAVTLSAGFKAEGEVNLVGATIGGHLNCDGGQFMSESEGPALIADGAKVEGSVSLHGFKAEGEVSLVGATIGGHLNCDGSQFMSKSEGPALNANGAKVEGCVFLRSFKAEGEVNLVGATIGRHLICDSGQFMSEGPALNANGAKIQSHVFLRQGFKAEGEVNLGGATIGGNLECEGGQFISKSEAPALDANGAQIQGLVFLRQGFKAAGGVNLLRATIGASLECDGGQFVSKGEAPALQANGAKIGGNVFLSTDFIAEGEVNLGGAIIGEDLACDSGQFVSKGEAPALDVNGAEIGGGVFLRQGFKAEGQVNLRGAKIRRNLECDGGQFVSKGEAPALDVNGAEIGGGVFLRQGFKAKGEVDFVAATIGGNLECDSGQFVSKGEVRALNADSVKVGGSVFFRNGLAEGEVLFAGAYVGGDFQWRDVESPKAAILNLQSAKVGTLFNDQNSWPSDRNLFIRGFVYDQIDAGAFPNADVQLGWLHLQPKKPFLPQPYEQLAKLLKSSGYESEATEVLIAKQDDLHRYGDLGFGEKCWKWILKYTIAYGYKPHLALLWVSSFLVLGTIFFKIGRDHKLMIQTRDLPAKSEEAYPGFHALVYSAEFFIPIVDLRQRSYWAPAENKGHVIVKYHSKLRSGYLLTMWFWFQTCLGWTLTTLWVAGFTGLVRRLN